VAGRVAAAGEQEFFGWRLERLWHLAVAGLTGLARNCDRVKKHNVGIVGCGWLSRAHITAINASLLAQVTSICSSRPLDSAKVSGEHAGPLRCRNDLEAFPSDGDLHVGSICSYPHDHARHALAAAKVEECKRPIPILEAGR
jgi:hypothetical protein